MDALPLGQVIKDISLLTDLLEGGQPGETFDLKENIRLSGNLKIGTDDLTNGTFTIKDIIYNSNRPDGQEMIPESAENQGGGMVL